MTAHGPKLVNGLWIPYNDPEGWLSKRAPVDGLPAYQYDRIEACLLACKQKRVCIDGGAHVGAWTVHLARHFRTVFAFEPVPSNFQCLIRNTNEFAGMDHMVLPVNVALSDRKGQLQMSAPVEGKSFSYAVSKSGETTVPCVDLDSMQLQDVDLIKLDLEGHEYEALQGAHHTLVHWHPVVIIEEKHDPKQRASGLLKDLGMKLRAEFKNDRLFVW